MVELLTEHADVALEVVALVLRLGVGERLGELLDEASDDAARVAVEAGAEHLLVDLEAKPVRLLLRGTGAPQNRRHISASPAQKR